MIVLNRRTPEDAYRYQAWPTVCADDAGTLWAVSSVRLRHIDPFGAIWLYKSTDGGATWSAGTPVIDTPYDDRDPGIAYIGDGKLLITFYYHTPKNYLENADHQWTDWKNAVPEAVRDAKLAELEAAAEQGVRGAAWVCILDRDTAEETRLTDTAGMVHVPVSAPHGVSVIRKTVGDLTAGSLLFVGRESYSGLAGIPVMVSTDGGATWTQRSSLNIGTIGSFYEAYAIQLNSGRLLSAFRVQGESSIVFSTYVTWSDDGGLTWTPAQKVTDGAPPHLTQLRDGTVVLTYGYRDWREKPTGIFARISRDGGETWCAEMRLADQPEVTPYDDLGYPCTVPLPDGSMLTVWYQHAGQDAYPSVLSLTWTLSDDAGSVLIQ